MTMIFNLVRLPESVNRRYGEDYHETVSVRTNTSFNACHWVYQASLEGRARFNLPLLEVLSFVMNWIMLPDSKHAVPECWEKTLDLVSCQKRERYVSTHD